MIANARRAVQYHYHGRRDAATVRAKLRVMPTGLIEAHAPQVILAISEPKLQSPFILASKNRKGYIILDALGAEG